MKNPRLILIVTVSINLLSLIFFGRRDLKRYLPAAIFISIVSTLLNKVAKKRVWWWFYKSVHPKIKGEDTWIWGLFFPIALWMLKSTYGNIRSFLIYDSILHILFIFPTLTFLKKVGIFSLVRINKLQYFLILSFRGILLYYFQFIKEYIGGNKKYVVSVNGKSQDRQVENLRS
ncbi:hypothetical protein ABEP42_00080 [Priestia megaterium]|uniref:hypothetical protein n=1 Tax=Priestia megaterium TaxID=1404 RepID=UPI00317CBB53